MNENKRKSVTMQDIAREVGVSKNAVSLALAGKRGVSEGVRRQIQEAARRMNYGAEAGNERACAVAVVPEYIRDDGSFYSDIFWAIEHEARKLGYMVLTAGLSRAAEENGQLPRVPDDMEPAGYLAIGIIRRAYLERLRDTGKPVVSVDIRDSAVPISSVCTDNLYGGRLATEYLLNKGHTRIGFAGPVFSAQSVYERYCGYQEALLRRGLPLDAGACIFGRRDGFELLDSAQTLGAYLEGIQDMPSAWFCAGDMIALSMCRLLSARGLAIPGDISVIGFDDLRVGEMISPPLTTIHVDRKLMGRQAVWQLLGQTRAVAETHLHILMPCSVVERSSVREISPRRRDTNGEGKGAL